MIKKWQLKNKLHKTVVLKLYVSWAKYALTHQDSHETEPILSIAYESYETRAKTRHECVVETDDKTETCKYVSRDETRVSIDSRDSISHWDTDTKRRL